MPLPRWPAGFTTSWSEVTSPLRGLRPAVAGGRFTVDSSLKVQPEGDAARYLTKLVDEEWLAARE